MKIGITCSTGKLGRRVYRETVKLAGGENVYAFARNPEKAKLLGHKNIIKADFDTPQELEEALSKIDVLCFITSMDPSIEKRKEQNHRVMEAAKKVKVKKIVLASFLGIIPFLGDMMRTLDRELVESGLTYVLCRNGYYIEPDVRDIPKHIKEGKIVNSAGDQKLAFTTRDEIAFAYARILTEESDKYDNRTLFVHGKALTQAELIGIINKVFGSEMMYEALTVDEYNKYLKERYAELPFVANIVGSIYQGIREGRFVGEESHFEMLTGRKHVDWEFYIEENKGKCDTVND